MKFEKYQISALKINRCLFSGVRKVKAFPIEFFLFEKNLPRIYLKKNSIPCRQFLYNLIFILFQKKLRLHHGSVPHKLGKDAAVSAKNGSLCLLSKRLLDKLFDFMLLAADPAFVKDNPVNRIIDKIRLLLHDMVQLFFMGLHLAVSNLP